MTLTDVLEQLIHPTTTWGALLGLVVMVAGFCVAQLILFHQKVRSSQLELNFLFFPVSDIKFKDIISYKVFSFPNILPLVPIFGIAFPVGGIWIRSKEPIYFGSRVCFIVTPTPRTIGNAISRYQSESH